jgi:hypothetical protein
LTRHIDYALSIILIIASVGIEALHIEPQPCFGTGERHDDDFSGLFAVTAPLYVT